MRPKVALGLSLVLLLTMRGWTQEAPTPSPPATPAEPPASTPSEVPSPTEEEPLVGEVVALETLTEGDHVNLLLESGQNFEGHVLKADPLPLPWTLSTPCNRWRV